MQQCPELVIVNNQNPDTIDSLNDVETPLNQLSIEIRQDTKGLLGLHASYKNNGQTETLALLSDP